MSDKQLPPADPEQVVVYQIRVKGHFTEPWTGWFKGLTILLAENGDTLLTGPVLIKRRCTDCSKKCVI
jgi:hypothetical protein